MNLKLWSIVMVVSMCIVFLAPSVSMNASAFDGGNGSVGDPYVITTVEELQAMNNNLNVYYVLGNDIDASDTESWNGGEGFEPIGSITYKFRGSLDGNNYTISNLHINRPSEDNVGLFGYTFDAHIYDVGLIDCNITGSDYVGSIIGYSYGSKSGVNTVEYSFSTGTIIGTANWCGGIIGASNRVSLEYCYSECDVTAIQGVGGLIGVITNTYVNYSYSIGGIPPVSYSGGLIGRNTDSSPVVDSFYDNDTSGMSDDVGKGTPKTTEEMQTLSTFTDAGWYIVEIRDHDNETWFINDGKDYPKLGWEDKPVFIQLLLDLEAMLPLIIILMFFMAIAGLLHFKRY